MKLTTASYRRPSGKNIHRFPDAKDSDEWGVMPDKGYDVKLNAHEMERLIDDRRERDILLGKHAKALASQNRHGRKTARPSKPAEEKPADEKPAERRSPTLKNRTRTKPDKRQSRTLTSPPSRRSMATNRRQSPGPSIRN